MKRLVGCIRVCILTLLTCVSAAAAQGQWIPPVGLPHPTFGITQTAQDCSDCTTRQQSVVNNLTDLQPGTIVEISGGPFEGFTVSGNATADKPIIIRGSSSSPLIKVTGQTQIRGSYLIVENIEFEGARANVRLDGHHLALRHCEVHNYDPGAPGADGSFGTAVVANDNANNIVIYNNDIHHNGDYIAPREGTEDDVHGIGAGSGTKHLWAVDNRIHHNGGDSLQFGHKEANSLSHFYIGRNVMYENGENAVDIKEASDVIISQNYIHGFNHTTAIVLHDCPENSWVLFNLIRDSRRAITKASLESACDSRRPVKVYALGNIIYDIGEEAITSWGGGTIFHIVGNTLYDTGGGINAFNVVAHLENNIVSQSSGDHVEVSGSTSRPLSSMQDNLFYQEAGSVSIDWSARTAVPSCPQKDGDGNCIANPRFADVSSYNLRLQAGSPAIDAGHLSSVVQTFRDSYRSSFIEVGSSLDSLDIVRGFNCSVRPVGPAVDIGAYEYNSSSECGSIVPDPRDAVPPSPPTNLRRD